MNTSDSLFYNIDKNTNNVKKDFNPFTPIVNNELMESNAKLKTWDGAVSVKKLQEIKEYIEK